MSTNRKLRGFAGLKTVLAWTAMTVACATTLLAQTTAFTYQGKLTDAGAPASGIYDFRVRLYDLQTGGSQIGPTFIFENAPVNNGAFTLTPDFGAGAFPGAARFLEIAVRPGASTEAFTPLSPLQPIQATPYSIKARTAAAADALSSSCAGCVVAANLGDASVTDSKIATMSGSKITGVVPVPSIPAGSANYIQNATIPQAANFSISGNGYVGGAMLVGSYSTAADFIYVAPQTAYYFVNEAAFSSRGGGPVAKTWANGGTYPTVSSTDGLVAPINLPDGATITNIQYRYLDDSANNLNFQFLLHPGSGYSAFGQHTSSVQSSTLQTVDVAVHSVVNNSAQSMEVLVYPTSAWGDGTMRVAGVRITYTMARAAR